MNVAVLGQKAVNAMFDVDVPLGRSFTFHGEEFIVRGIFSDFRTSSLSQEANYNNAIFIPYQKAQELTNNATPVYEILAKPTNQNQAPRVAKNIQRNLDAAHGGQSSLRVAQSSENQATSDSVLDLLTRLIAGVAAISIIVGGIGIMNVMLVSVAERMHEIGIRKAVGATNRQILSQFMVEATVLSSLGGLIGIVVAVVADIALRFGTDLQPIITWPMVVLATGVSVLMGIVFGSVPALKAARRDPIDALRTQ
jgi:putative ABC transport system permease protein